ncbi:hypothetical protein PF005_g3791 [Phytophthora fragariae]|uniref:Pectate lyase n=1 Tax=Phytophthora fragariae TaxID=53985 RepID=A0A6A3TE99_9STRA|nr:hypothetical protein PF003_g31154 [Phytophthora fragariae]KAE8946408.1 hypothetical protein PF009_g3948 [Phytophthora fragariae]KAE9025417.1 hypothetical protein PF011_g3039 [Phytophthora fragariae]KAE9131827.1 hypothetical protein PF010_g3390 [Phytophthora fragariae]KAE9132464.1 hypothetical protein PF007_g3702 [Phytophthora fragariae]
MNSCLHSYLGKLHLVVVSLMALLLSISSRVSVACSSHPPSSSLPSSSAPAGCGRLPDLRTIRLGDQTTVQNTSVFTVAPVESPTSVSC